MRSLAIGLLLALPSAARAETGEELRARGEQLAKDGRFSEAIDAFKAAERIEPRSRHACLIALAYLRRELWPQAEIFLAQCEQRATAADPMPEWVPTAKQQLAERIAAVNVAPVTIKVEPEDAAVTLAVSSFAPDELFAPRAIHLPPGRHVILASAPGYQDAQETVEITDRTAREVTIKLTRPDTTPPPEHVIQPEPTPPSAPPSKVPYAVIGGGVALAAAGAIVHATLFRSAKSDLEAAATLVPRDAYDAAEERYDRWQALSIGLYAAGAVTIGVGVVLKLTTYRERTPTVAVVPRDGGGMVTVGWSR